MEPTKMAKQMMDFYKTTFDNSFNAMVMLQEQTEKTMAAFMDQATWLPDEGKNVMEEWVKAYKKGREDFKKTIDDGFKKVDEYFSQATMTK